MELGLSHWGRNKGLGCSRTERLGLRRAEVTADRSRPHSGALHDQFCSSYIVGMIKSKENEMGRACGMHGWEEKCTHTVLMGKRDGKRQVWRHMCRWDNIKIDTEVWNNPSQSRDNWWALRTREFLIAGFQKCGGGGGFFWLARKLYRFLKDCPVWWVSECSSDPPQAAGCSMDSPCPSMPHRYAHITYPKLTLNRVLTRLQYFYASISQSASPWFNFSHIPH